MSIKFFGGVYGPKIIDGCGSIKYFGGLHPKIFHGCMSVKYLRDLHPQKI